MARNDDRARPGPGQDQAGGGASALIFQLLQEDGDDDDLLPVPELPPESPWASDQEELESLRSRVRSLTAELAGRTHAVDAMETSTRESQLRIEELETLQKTWEQDKQQWEATRVNLLNEQVRLQREWEEKGRELREQLREQRNRFLELEEERDQLRAEISHLKARGELEARSGRVGADPGAEVEILKRRLAQVEEARREMVGERDDALERLDEITQRLRWAESNNRQQAERVRELEQAQQTWESREQVETATTLAVPSTIAGELERERKAREDIEAELDELYLEREQLSRELGEARAAQMGLRVQLAEKEEQLLHLKEEVTVGLAPGVGPEMDLRDLDELPEVTRMEVDPPPAFELQLHQIRQELELREEELANVRQELAERLAQLAELGRERDQWVDELEKTQRERAPLELRVHELESQLSRSQAQMREVSAHLQGAEVAQAFLEDSGPSEEMTSLRNRLEATEAARRQLTRSVEEAEVKRGELMAELRTLQGRMEGLEQDLRRREREKEEARHRAMELSEDLHQARRALKAETEGAELLKNRILLLEKEIRDAERDRQLEVSRRQQREREVESLKAEMSQTVPRAPTPVEPISPWAPGPDGAPPRGLRNKQGESSPPAEPSRADDPPVWDALASGKRFRAPSPAEEAEAAANARRPLPPDWEVIRRPSDPPLEPSTRILRAPVRDINDPDEPPEPRWQPGADGPRPDSRGNAPPPGWGRPIVEIDEAPEWEEVAPRRSAEVSRSDLQGEAEVRSLMEEGRPEDASRRARALWRKSPEDGEMLRLYLEAANPRRGGLGDVVADLEERLPATRSSPEGARAISQVLLHFDLTREAVPYLLWALSRSRVPADDPLLQEAAEALRKIRKGGERNLRTASLLATLNTLPLVCLGPLFFLLEGYRVQRADGWMAGAQAGDFLVGGQDREVRFGPLTFPADQKIFARPLTLSGTRSDRATLQEIDLLTPPASVRGTPKYRLSFALCNTPVDGGTTAELMDLRRRQRHYLITLSRVEMVEGITRATGGQILMDRISR